MLLSTNSPGGRLFEETPIRKVSDFLTKITVLCILTLLALTTAETVRSAIQIGGDEPFEVTKGLLWAKGYPLYKQIWNDQPPLYTVLLGTFFKLSGVDIGAARLLAEAYGIILLTSCFFLVKRTCGAVSGYVAVLGLLVSPRVFELSISTMLEVPAIATALCALIPLQQLKEDSKTRWLVLSGILFGIALQTKLTAAVFAPALVIEISIVCREGAFGRWLRTSFKSLLIWCGAVALTFTLCGAALGCNYNQWWTSHFSAHTAEATAASRYAFSPRVFLEHIEALWGLAAVPLVLVIRRDYDKVAFPLVLLITVVIVHALHRPWWSYYYVHFALPLSWLTGYAIGGLLENVWRGTTLGPLRTRSTAFIGAVYSSIVISLLLLNGGTRLFSDVSRIRGLPRATDCDLLLEMRKYSRLTKWVYTRETMYPFFCKLAVIPDLAVLPAKRFWSKQITAKDIPTLVANYRPEQILFGNGKISDELKDLVIGAYTLAYNDGNYLLYIETDVFQSEQELETSQSSMSDQ